MCARACALQKWSSLIRQRVDSADELPSLLHNLRLAFPPESTFAGDSAPTGRGTSAAGMESIHLHYLFSLWFLQSHSLQLQPPPSSPSLLMFLFCAPHPRRGMQLFQMWWSCLSSGGDEIMLSDEGGGGRVLKNPATLNV